MMNLYNRLRKFFVTEPYAVEALPEIKFLAKRTAIWLVVCEIAMVAQLYPARWFVDAFVGKPNYSKMLSISAFIAIIYFFGAYMHTRMDNWRNSFNQRLFAMWWSAGHRKELELSTAWHVQHGTGEKEALIGKNINRIEMTADYLLFEAVPIILRIVITSIAMSFIGWQFVVLAILTFLFYVAVSLVNAPALSFMAWEYNTEHRALEEFGTVLLKIGSRYALLVRNRISPKETKQSSYGFIRAKFPGIVTGETA